MAKPKAPAHGTRARYYYGDGCRCAQCREANAAYQRNQRDGNRHPSGTVPVRDGAGNVIAHQPPMFDE